VNGDITLQNLQDDKLELLIDKAKYFAFTIDDIDEAQADINIMKELTMDAAQQMKIAIETQFLSTTYADAGNNIASTALTKDNVMEWIIKRFKLSAKTIADFFGGSGSTLIAAEKNGIQAFIMEFDPKFCDVIVKRWEDFTGKKAVLEVQP